jgi:hypothetical protein
LVVNVSDLKLDGEIMVNQVPLPEGVKMLSDGHQVAVHCIKPKEEGEEGATAVAGEGAEPELIRKEKPADEEEES